VDVKTESKILLTALATAPTVLGIMLVASGEATLGGALLILVCLIIMFLIWRPRKGSGKKK
jgi:cellobiose-specific phosphotransferase system component IIC